MAEKMKRHIKDPGSAITHFIGMLMAIFAAVPLMIKAAKEPEPIYVISIAVYAISLILLYAASTSYHTFICSGKITTILKKIDHMMIFVLIAGSYTPICLLVLKGKVGIGLCLLVWGIAAVGIIVAVLNQLLVRSGREEQAMLTTLAGLIVVLSMIVTEISALFDTIKSLFGL